MSGWSLRSVLGLRDSLFRISMTRTGGATGATVPRPSLPPAQAGAAHDHLSRPDGSPAGMVEAQRDALTRWPSRGGHGRNFQARLRLLLRWLSRSPRPKS